MPPSLLQTWQKKAASLQKTICFPEAAQDPRTLQAAATFAQKGYGIPLFIGKPETFTTLLKKANLEIPNLRILDPNSNPYQKELINHYQTRRKKENLTHQQTLEVLSDPVYFAACLTALSHADGVVAGAIHSSAHVLRAAFKCIGPKPSIRTVSSTFFMLTPKPEFGENGILLFSDCAVVPEPTSEQLVDIAAATAETYQTFLTLPPTIAFLSFSTKGSANSPFAETVAKAAEIFHKNYPQYLSDGEIQVDTALSETVAKIKHPTCRICGKTNILIFPNLSAANIGYKLVQRLGNAQAVGPLLQGLAKPMNDLSRGCTTEDIVQCAVLTALQAEAST